MKDIPKKDITIFNINSISDVPKPIGIVKTIKFFSHCHILINKK